MVRGSCHCHAFTPGLILCPHPKSVHISSAQITLMNVNANPPAAENDQQRDPEANMPPRRSQSSIPSILFVTFILFMLTNNRTDDVSTRTHYVEALDAMYLEMGNYSAWLRGNASSNFTLVSMCFQSYEYASMKHCSRLVCSLQ